MKITNKVTDAAYTQWIEQFVQDVLEASGLYGDEVIIEDIEPNKRIFITVDGLQHDIRTWGFVPVATDENGKPCAENVQYTLFQMVEDEDGGGHGEEVDAGTLTIRWENQEEIDMKENKTTEQVIKETGEAFTEGMVACAMANVATNVTGEVVRDNGTEKVANSEK